MSQLSEAEISGNDDMVRELLVKLCNRDLFPAKVLCFHTDARPGYFGTWTRSSKFIGPRRPFAQDTLVFDYAYDSGEEWEEEPIGEDVVDDVEDEDGDDEERDSDMDDWLVDDDEEQDLTQLSRVSTPLPIVDIPVPSPPKRKVEEGERKSSKKRKVVVPLQPFAKGPVWESTIGQPKYEPFCPYTIRLFNGECCKVWSSSDFLEIFRYPISYRSLHLCFKLSGGLQEPSTKCSSQQCYKRRCFRRPCSPSAYNTNFDNKQSSCAPSTACNWWYYPEESLPRCAYSCGYQQNQPAARF
jgi:hypothetical protein